MGPTYKSFKNGYKYYISFIDVFSRFTWIYFLESKTQAFSTFVQFKTLVENLLNAKILTFKPNDGGEFKSFSSYLKTHGIQHRISCPYTSQQIEISERKHCHIVDTSLTMLSHSSMPLEFWDDAFLTVVYLINRLPSHLLIGKVLWKNSLIKNPTTHSQKPSGAYAIHIFALTIITNFNLDVLLVTS